jgi:hypothetical protein
MGVKLCPGRGVATRALSSSTKGSRLLFLLGVDGLSVFSGDLGVDELESRPLSII